MEDATTVVVNPDEQPQTKLDASSKDIELQVVNEPPTSEKKRDPNGGNS